MVEMAKKQRVHLSCHQNRRWDVDYLAIKQALAHGLIGDLFYMETFVGSFAHPCGYWHSHDAIPVGTTYHPKTGIAQTRALSFSSEPSRSFVDGRANSSSLGRLGTGGGDFRSGGKVSL